MLVVCPACQQHALLDSARSEQDCAHCGSSLGRRALEAALIGVVAFTTAACYGGPPPNLANPPPPAPTAEPTPSGPVQAVPPPR